jgi:signal peptidase I
MCEVAVPAALPPVPRRLRRETGVFRAGKPCMFGIAAVMVAALCPWRLGVAVGSSMAPTLVSGQPFVYDRGYYRSHPLKRGDVVVMKVGREIWVKRVYAGPGEQFWAFRERDGRSVRTSPVRPADRARFVQVGRNWQRRSRMRYAVVRVALGPEQVFLIGDGAYSFDSRQWGPVGSGDRWPPTTCSVGYWALLESCLCSVRWSSAFPRGHAASSPGSSAAGRRRVGPRPCNLLTSPRSLTAPASRR